MKRISLLIICLLVIPFVTAQKKTDLLEDNRALNALVERNEATIRDLQQQVSRLEAINETYKFESDNLKTTNKALMERLSKFANQSVTNIMNIGDQIESMRSLEKQNQFLKSALTRHDSILIETLKKLRPFVSKAKGMVLEPGGVRFPLTQNAQIVLDSLHTDKRIQSIDTVLNAHPFYQLEIIHNATNSTFKEALFKTFTEKLNQPVERFSFSRTLADTLYLRLTPNHSSFYKEVRAMIQ
ncbi:MAG: hypothetical protein VW236_05670 [Flavobacteriaceae bacterium]